MAILDLFSKRQKAARGEIDDVFTYDNIPEKLRVQIIHIISECIGSRAEYKYNERIKGSYSTIVEALCREYGTFKLPHSSARGVNHSYADELMEFILKSNTEMALDAIELCFRFIRNVTSRYSYRELSNADQIAQAAIDELNIRFKENCVGYNYLDGEIVRVDSEYIHSEAVKPALIVLSNPMFAGAQNEFLSAHEHYRHGRNKEALNDCLKSFESIMKAICTHRGWAYNEHDTARALIDVVLKNEIVPPFWQTHFSSLRSMLESSIPTGRNRLSGHGQGAEEKTVPNYLTSYMLHMTAATILFLSESEKARPPAD